MQIAGGRVCITRKNLHLWVLGALIIAAALLIFSPSKTWAVPNQLDGTVYWDQNGNGVHDDGEPGLEGVVVRFGFNVAATTTDANGNYTLSGVSGISTLEVHSGWFRTQCNDVNCTAGPGADNDFNVDNQLIRLTGTDADAGGTFSVGLVPDWGSDYPMTTLDQPRPVDIAVRFSYDNGCTQGTVAERLCSPGDSVVMRANFLNQGTGPISNPVFALQLPVGHTPGTWYADGGTAQPGADTVTEIQPFDPNLGYGLYQLNGTIPAGSSSSMYNAVTVEPNAVGSPTPYATSSPRDKLGTLQVLAIDQTGDPDSNFCLGSGQNYAYGSCDLNPLGQHNKLLATDHTDGSDWNVTGTPEPKVDSMQVALDGTSTDICEQDTVQTQLTVTNTSTGDTPLRNVEIAIDVPSGLTFELADNPGWFTGGDGRPHTFVNLALLPNGSQTVPLNLIVNDDVTSADNGTAALQITSEIVAYDTTELDGNENFIPGSLSGTLSSQNDITVNDDNCQEPTPGPGPNPGPTPGPDGDGTTPADEAGELASTGMNVLAPIVVAASLLGVSGALLWRRWAANR